MVRTLEYVHQESHKTPNEELKHLPVVSDTAADDVILTRSHQCPHTARAGLVLQVDCGAVSINQPLV